MNILNGNDIDYIQFDLPQGTKRVWILGGENEGEIATHIFNAVSGENLRWILYYSSMDGFVEEMKNELGCCHIEYFAPVRLPKHIWKHYPVILANSEKKEVLLKILQDWTTATYIEEFVCVYDEKDEEFVIQTIKDNIYYFDSIPQLLMSRKVAIIKTIYDADSVNSYDVIYEKDRFKVFNEWIEEKRIL